MIPVLKPSLHKQGIKELVKVIKSGWWGQGPKTIEFEIEFAKKLGVKYAIATNSCTSALDMALKVYNIKDGELITTAMTFVADAIVGEWNNLDVTFADIKEDTLCIDPESITITPKTKAIIAVHSHGRLADIRGIRKKFKGLIIEDCAHACFTPKVGLMGDIAVWSFQAVKSLPCGDGGMITTNNKRIAQKLRDMSWLGVQKSTYSRTSNKKYSWDYDIKQTGVKSYMNDINAVIALENLKRIDKLTEKRRKIQKKYNEAFKDLDVILPEYSHTVQYYTLKVKNRDKISNYLAEQGIATSVHFKPLSEMTYWKKAVKRELPVTDKIWKELLSLPCYYDLTNKQQNYIIKTFKEAVKKINK